LLGLALNHLLAKEAVTEWGWRIPFVVGCLIVLTAGLPADKEPFASFWRHFRQIDRDAAQLNACREDAKGSLSAGNPAVSRLRSFLPRCSAWR
jgi:hypothetical protein